MIRIFCESWPGEVRVAAVDDADTLFAGMLDVGLWRPGDPDGLGDLLAGRVTARVPAMAGAFVALGAVADGFLPDSEGAAGLTEGERVAVRVTRSAHAGKGPRLTARVSDADAAAAAGRPTGPIRPGPNPVERLAALHPAAPVVAGAPALLAALRPALGTRVAAGPARFADDVADAVDELTRHSVAAPNGAVLRFSPTPALVAIDVDSAAATGRAGASASAWNAALLPALARQIRLRDLSGAIVVDLAGMAAKRRAALAPAFADALSADPRKPRFLGFTALGLAEIVRARTGAALHEALSGPHAAGLAALRAAVQAGTSALTVAPDIARALDRDAAARREAEDWIAARLRIASDANFAPSRWRLGEA